jgi:hypothetical protein
VLVFAAIYLPITMNRLILIDWLWDLTSDSWHSLGRGNSCQVDCSGYG